MVLFVDVDPRFAWPAAGEAGDLDIGQRFRLVQDVDRATPEDAVDGGKQIARVGSFQPAVEDQVGEQGAIGFQDAARAFPEFAGDQVAGNRGMGAVDVDDDGIEAARAAGDETPGVVGDELAARRFAQEVLFGDRPDCRIDVDIGAAGA